MGTHAGSVEVYDKILTSRPEFNQPWAKAAPVLVMSLVETHFSHDSNPNA